MARIAQSAIPTAEAPSGESRRVAACPVLVCELQRLRAAYRAKIPLDAGWTLLRGEATDVQDLAMLLGVKYKQDARSQFAHTNLITVLNPAGEIAHQHPGLQGDVSAAAKAVVDVAQRAPAPAKAE